jgi:membrane protease YdiL (CAAX protease family)
MDGAASASSEVPAAPPATSVPKDLTGFLPTFWQGLGLVAPLLALTVLFWGLGRLLAMLIPANVPGAPMPVLLSLLPTAAPVLVMLILGRRWARLGWREAFPFPLPRPGQVGAFLVLFAGLELACQGLDPIVDGWLPPMPSFVERAFASLPWVEVVVIAPLFEELFFRGLVLNGMRRRYPAWKAIGLSTLLFALSHANPWQLAIPLLTGVVFGWVVVRTGTLWLPLIGHAVHNGRAMLEGGGTLSNYFDPRRDLGSAGGLAALLLSCAGAFLLAGTTIATRPSLGWPPPPGYPPAA